MKKCKYCNKKNIQKDFCNDDCKKKAEKYFNYWKKYKYVFGCMLVIYLLSTIMQVILFPKYVIITKAMTMILGITLFVFPFGNTIDTMGIKNTVFVARICSIVLIIYGVISIIRYLNGH